MCVGVHVCVRICVGCLRGDSLPAPGCQSAFSFDVLMARWGSEKVREGHNVGRGGAMFFGVCVSVCAV